MAFLTQVHLLNVPLENDYKNTLYFDNLSSQTDYFLSRNIISFRELSYQRKDFKINVPKHYDTLQTCNYVMYRNPVPALNPTKWYYAFITEMKYINDEMTEIYIETDCMQTWLFDFTVKSSFVEREHVDNDTIGIHTVPEQLETGDYICNSAIDEKKLKSVTYLIGSTVKLSEEDTPDVFGTFYDGLYSGLEYFGFFVDTAGNTLLSRAAENGKADAIQCLFTAPANYIDFDGNRVVPDGGLTGMPDGSKKLKWSDSVPNYDCTAISKPTTINGYTPKNKKLLSYPFNYLLMSNNSGGSAIYKYELFTGSTMDFEIQYSLCPGGSLQLIPLNYGGQEKNYNERLVGCKFPICNWNSDIYTNWLTQNSVNIPLQIASGIGTIAGGVGLLYTGAGALAGAGSIAGGVMSIASTIGEVYSHSLQPPQSEGNISSGDVNFASGKATYTAYLMSIKSEYAKIIDDYFTMFGYKVNRVKIPNKNHRSRFWYTKTIDINIDGAIPNKDMQIIKNCYNNGVTFWRSADDINNYNDANNIL